MRRRDDLDSRISPRAVELFRLGKTMRAQGFDPREVISELSRELNLRPWMPGIFDEDLFEAKVPQERADYYLYDLLEEAA